MRGLQQKFVDRIERIAKEHKLEAVGGPGIAQNHYPIYFQKPELLHTLLILHMDFQTSEVTFTFGGPKKDGDQFYVPYLNTEKIDMFFHELEDRLRRAISPTYAAIHDAAKIVQKGG